MVSITVKPGRLSLTSAAVALKNDDLYHDNIAVDGSVHACSSNEKDLLIVCLSSGFL
jgi:hypothetical protein